LLIHTEQGFGDAIQFIRYLQQVAARRGDSGKIILQCQPELQRLFQSFGEIDQLILRGEALPHFDVHCPLLTLPMVFGTTLESIPTNVPYLKADAELSSRWRERMPREGLKVGIAWAGRSTHPNDHNRSTTFDTFAPLAQVDGVHLFSLQKRSDSSLIDLPSFLSDWTDELHDFVDTAALIDNLDLVITIDSAVAHLAGAMGKPVWVLLPQFADWRWLLDRTDSPWYPTMRLFQQPTFGDWQSPMQNVVTDLQKLNRDKR
jgi:hypothetical protein